MTGTPADMDEASKQRMKKFIALGVRPTGHLPVAEYKSIFMRHYFQSRAILEQCEKVWRMMMMMCPNCEETNTAAHITAHPLLVQVDSNMSSVFGTLVHLSCHGCGFEEYYPAKDVRLYAEPHAKTATEIMQQRRNLLASEDYESIYESIVKRHFSQIGNALAQATDYSQPPSPFAEGSENGRSIYERAKKKLGL